MKLSAQHALVVLFVSWCTCTTALAQYVWLDENGHKQFSDQAPPASVPKNKILKFAGKTTDDSHFTVVIPNPDEQTKRAEDLADKNLAYKKRRDEALAKEKKEAADAKTAAEKSENCRRMKAYKQSLEAGGRVAQVDAAGNRSFITDEKRAEELNELRQNMSECGD